MGVDAEEMLRDAMFTKQHIREELREWQEQMKERQGKMISTTVCGASLARPVSSARANIQRHEEVPRERPTHDGGVFVRPRLDLKERQTTRPGMKS